jgi:hypothetical protein
MRNIAGVQLACFYLGGKAPGNKVLVSPALSILDASKACYSIW